MGQWSVKPEILRLPSEYVGTNVFVGLSPFSPRQDPTGDVFGKDAEGRSRPGFHLGAASIMYGVDFPHFETCFHRNLGEVATLVSTPVITDAEAHNILFDTAADVYGFDVDALRTRHRPSWFRRGRRSRARRRDRARPTGVRHQSHHRRRGRLRPATRARAVSEDRNEDRSQAGSCCT